MSLQEQIQNEIQVIVPQMIEEALTTQSHNGVDGQQIQGNNLLGAPQASLTAAVGGTLTSGGGPMATADSIILTNALQRLAELESRFQSLGLLD